MYKIGKVRKECVKKNEKQMNKESNCKPSPFMAKKMLKYKLNTQ